MHILIYPKLNIFLKIIGFQAGFHQLQSRFVLAQGGLYDEMYISTSNAFALKGDFGCALEDNLIYKAKCALEHYLHAHNKPTKALDSIKVEVLKRIPKGAGLGGGSGNAGAFLKAINTFLSLGLTQNALLDIAKGVGADVAFFASGVQSANVRGRGEIIESTNTESANETSLDYEIYTPSVFCDTKKVYQYYADSIKANKRAYSEPVKDWFKLSSKALLEQHKDRAEMNDLFLSALKAYPALLDVARNLGQEWYFSGSGSSFFRLKKA